VNCCDLDGEFISDLGAPRVVDRIRLICYRINFISPCTFDGHFYSLFTHTSGSARATRT
jgi:hypothetical protein